MQQLPLLPPLAGKMPRSGRRGSLLILILRARAKIKSCPHPPLRGTFSREREKEKPKGSCSSCLCFSRKREKESGSCPGRADGAGREMRWKPADKPGSVVGSHSSRSCVAAGLERPTRERRGPRHGSPIRSCSRWGLPCRSVARLAVRSYRTVSPLPDPPAPPAIRKALGRSLARTPIAPIIRRRHRRPSAVCSLLHFPSARAAQALPGTLPCGARTFLGAQCATRLPGRLPS